MFDSDIPFYSISIIISLIANIIVILSMYKKYSYDKAEIIGLLVYENIGIILGAKILSYLTLDKELKTGFNFISAGLSSYGGVIGALIFILIFCLQFKKSIKETIYILLPSIPLMYSIGKIGCFLVGCCYGIEYNGIFSIVYNYSKVAPKGISLFPVQLAETIVFLLIFIYLIYKHIKRSFDIKTICIGLIMCGMAKFMLDFLRISHKNIILSTNQVISSIFILISVIVLIKEKKKAGENI